MFSNTSHQVELIRYNTRMFSNTSVEHMHVLKHFTSSLSPYLLTSPCCPNRYHLRSLPGTKFSRVIPDAGPASQNPEEVKRVIFCTGKVYYELAKERKQRNTEGHVAIVRLEQVTAIFHMKLFLKLWWVDEWNPKRWWMVIVCCKKK